MYSHYFCFTEFLDDEQLQYYCGLSLGFFLCINTAFNMFIILWQTFTSVKKKFFDKHLHLQIHKRRRRQSRLPMKSLPGEKDLSKCMIMQDCSFPPKNKYLIEDEEIGVQVENQGEMGEGKGKKEKKGNDHKQKRAQTVKVENRTKKDICLLYTSPSPRDLSTSRMPSSA